VDPLWTAPIARIFAGRLRPVRHAHFEDCQFGNATAASSTRIGKTSAFNQRVRGACAERMSEAGAVFCSRALHASQRPRGLGVRTRKRTPLRERPSRFSTEKPLRYTAAHPSGFAFA